MQKNLIYIRYKRNKPTQWLRNSERRVLLRTQGKLNQVARNRQERLFIPEIEILSQIVRGQRSTNQIVFQGNDVNSNQCEYAGCNPLQVTWQHEEGIATILT